MKFLADNGYSVIAMAELAEAISNGKQYLPHTVVITFDDGFEDNFTYAFPVLAKHGMPAVMFLITGYVDRKDGYLTWDQVRLMQKNGITFGGHTRNNVYLPSITDTAGLRDEIAGSREDIKENTGAVADIFCYPTGGFNEEIKEVVKNAGYKAACTTNRGPARLNRDIYALKRAKITNSDMKKPFHFRAKLSGFYNAFRKIKKSD
ncbi:MAG: polysaccharide deacetylase family protein [Candidatus Omnitrophica bacterium]|nr:polysaccharide deacetylase family protein [Candidatus Omnitrophota bacterium]MBU1851447.1 polysaccharide deacetylase family protein [Candidatus Omnitrophota bacterium]